MNIAPLIQSIRAQAKRNRQAHQQNDAQQASRLEFEKGRLQLLKQPHI